MHIRIATFYIKPEHVQDFKKATLENQKNSRQEPGVIHFNFHQGADDPTRFVLYEMFESDDAFEYHKTTPHFNKWLPAVQDWFVKPRDLALYREVQAD